MWKEELDRDRLLIPMKVEALPVGAPVEGQGYTDAAANFRMLEYTSLAKHMQTSPFTYTDPLQKGVHLHWILPEAFTHGEQKEEMAEVIYPEAPDKWLIIRILIKDSRLLEPRIELRSFVVESKYISSVRRGENRDSQPYPLQDGAGRMDYVYLGRFVDGKEIPGPGRYLDSLKAFGYGDPSFFAYYQSCRNVFGFYDALEDVEEGELSYLVCGWFRDKKQDPLNQGKPLFQVLDEWGWKLKKEGSGEDRCTSILCHGAVHGISWKGPEHAYPSGVPEETPSMAIGNNSGEAICALLMQKMGKGAKAERLLYSFLNGTADQVEQQDGIIRMEQTIHENMFDVSEGEQSWILKEREHGKGEEGAPEPDWKTACALFRLNKREKELDQSIEKRKRLEKEIYFLWFQYMAKSRTEKMQKEEKSSYVEELKHRLTDYKAQLKHIRIQRVKLHKEKEELERALTKQQHYKLVATRADSYYEPAEPVLLFAGKGISNLFGGKEQEDQRGGEPTLLCRSYSQIVGEFYGEKKLRKLNLRDYGKRLEDWYDYPPIIRKLLGETFLQLPSLTVSLARRFLASEMGSSPPGALDQLCKDFRSFFDALFSGAVGKGFFTDGVAPAPAACSTYTPAYQPLFMDWGIFYHPDEDSLGEKEHMKKWRLDQIDYELTEDIAFSSYSEQYTGKMALTSHAVENIREAMKGYQDKAGEELKARIHAVKARFENLEILSQRLNGFQEYFLRERQAMHLPLEALWEEDQEIRALMEQELTSENRRRFYEHLNEHMMTDPFLESIYAPVRAGFMEIGELRLVDTFGRVKVICSEENYELEAKAMAFSENLRREGEEEKIVLPPRIMFPTRLRAAFLSARDKRIETLDAKCTSPIFGWVIPGYMDGSLSVLDEKGRLLGKFASFRDRKGKTIIHFVNSARVDSPKENGRMELPKGIGRRLQDFLEGFRESMASQVEQDPQILYDFVNHLCYDLGNMKQHKGIHGGNPWLMGQPLALAELSLTLESKEDPGRMPDWDWKSRKPSSLEKIQFPVFVGDKRRRDDGLAGFFRGNHKERYHQIHMEKPESFDAGTYISAENKLFLSWRKTETITVLFDPLLPIHLISGILPVKKAELPREVAEGSLAQIRPELFVHPVLKGGQELFLPLPEESGKEWAFVRLENGIYREQQKVKKEGINGLQWDYPMSVTEGWLQLREEEAVDTVQSST